VADKGHILAVEDDLELGQMLQAYFRERGYEATALTSGEEALQWLEEASPNIILLDIHLPGIDGFEVCRQLRNDNRFRHTPVIFLTRRSAQGDRLAGLALGAVDYLAKPFDVEELGLRVRNALSRANMANPINPVTGLPQDTITRQRVAEALGQPPWGIVVARLSGLQKFSETYGFIAADDVARATGLMIRQIVDASGGCDFLGHLDAAEFAIITTLGQASLLAEQCRQRLATTVPYFYPAADWQALQAGPDLERLRAHVTALTSEDGPIGTPEEFHQAVQRAR
jgi:CheY-like chemotaxis protein